MMHYMCTAVNSKLMHEKCCTEVNIQFFRDQSIRLADMSRRLGASCLPSRHYRSVYGRHVVSHNFAEGRYKGLRKPEREDKLRSGHQQLRYEALEKG